jgi:hypothetical protein
MGFHRAFLVHLNHPQPVYYNPWLEEVRKEHWITINHQEQTLGTTTAVA